MLAEQRPQWPLFVPVAVGIGIILWFNIPFNHEREATVLAALALSLFGLFLGGRWRLPLFFCGLLIVAGLFSADWRSSRVAAPRLFHYLSADSMEGVVRRVEVRQGGSYTRLLLWRDARYDDPPLLLQLTFNGKPAADLVPGVRVRVRASLAPVAGATYPGGYSPAQQAWFAGISATGRILAPPEIVAAPQGTAVAHWRNRLAEAISRHLPGQAGAVAVALVVGDQGRVSPAVRNAMQVSGLAHLLSVSGFHVSTVAGIVFLAMQRLLSLVPAIAYRFSVRRIAVGFALVAVFTYLLISGVQIPALRASIGVAIAMLALFFGRNPITLRLVAFAALVILFWQPESLLSPSFQLSFAAVTTLIALASSAFGRRWLSRQEGDGPLFRSGRLVAALFLSSLVAEIALMPIALAHFGRTGAYGAIANMLAIPLTSFVIMPMLGVWLLLLPFGLQGLVGWLLGRAINFLVGIAATVSLWPGARADVSAVPMAGYAAIVVGGILLVLLVGRARLLGVPTIVVGVVLIAITPPPLLLVSPDRRQVAIVGEKSLYLLAGHRNGLLVRSWGEATRRVADKRMPAWPGAACIGMECRVEAGGVPILVTHASPDFCPYDIVISAGVPGEECRPRRLRIDRADRLGAVAIHRNLRIDSVAARTGDHPWGPDAAPGVVERLFGGRKWIGVMIE